jgi:hypothetical protein
LKERIPKEGEFFNYYLLVWILISHFTQKYMRKIRKNQQSGGRGGIGSDLPFWGDGILAQRKFRDFLNFQLFFSFFFFFFFSKSDFLDSV